jgi:hypothetical protein
VEALSHLGNLDDHDLTVGDGLYAEVTVGERAAETERTVPSS